MPVTPVRKLFESITIRNAAVVRARDPREVLGAQFGLPKAQQRVVEVDDQASNAGGLELLVRKRRAGAARSGRVRTSSLRLQRLSPVSSGLSTRAPREAAAYPRLSSDFCR